MTNILIVHSSARPAGESVTRQLTIDLTAALTRALPSVVIAERDLAGVSSKPQAAKSPESMAVAGPDSLIDELLWADLVVIGAPMYNFGIPAVLKGWIDQVASAGRTFRYDQTGGVEGLVRARRAYVVTSRGGDYGDGHVTTGNFVDPYLRVVLGFLGIADVVVIAANGQALDPLAREQGMATARLQIAELATAA